VVFPASKEKVMFFLQNMDENPLPLLISRTVIFFSVMCLLTLSVYAAGVSQGFMDSTQLALLRLSTVLGIFLAVSSIFGIAVDLVRFFMYRNPRYFLGAGIYLLFVLFGIITLLIAMSIITLSNGNGA
jgi:hypothetical protein